jgi:hypothetical protein
MKAIDRGGWLIICASLVLAAISFIVSNARLIWGSEDYGPVTQIAGFIGAPTFVLWLVTTSLAWKQYGKAAWWVLLGVPFAFWTPLRIIFYFVAMITR